MYIAISLIHLFKPLDKKCVGGGGAGKENISKEYISKNVFEIQTVS